MSLVNTHSFGQFWHISWTITHHFGVPNRFPWLTNPGVHLRVGHQHSQFWPILVCFVQYYSMFWGPRAISTIDDPGVRLLVHRHQSQFWLILTRFMDYYSPFWGPEAIWIVVEPQGALTCRSSTLIVFADSSTFRGLLLTVLGSRRDFHD